MRISELMYKALGLLREFLESFWWGFPLNWDEDCAGAVTETGEDGQADV
jgi:hypothetical protein